ncbi:GNAT family N-acetyltransferase [Ulvibacterium marinum]|uniref:GNAT family N-acetyltransferase n=1 Tax=Ulvibacterium marinum TaxID=2419782 RepID=A0A3B0CEI6_9FLAO|nr:GNAT family N-acetyltransferase [Ulvibacterium marinum]RKN83521.1 GNAT family N-acetyltransferase [Ulvibacterium marinum]
MKVKFEIVIIEYIPKLLAMMGKFNAIYDYPFNAIITEQNLTEFLGNASLGRLWLIYAKSKPIGYFVLTFGFSFEYGGRDAFIDELFIEEDFRQRGVGKKTMKFVLSEAKRLHIKAVHLEVEKHNKKGHQLYIKSGFMSTYRELLTNCLIE